MRYLITLLLAACATDAAWRRDTQIKEEYCQVVCENRYSRKDVMGIWHFGEQKCVCLSTAGQGHLTPITN